jgi:gluconolactonase
MAASASEIARQPREVSVAFTDGYSQLVGIIERTLAKRGSAAERRKRSLAITAAMIGKAVSVSTAFSLAESPVWDHCKNVLLFADVDPQRIQQLAPPSTVTVFQEMSNYTNGMSFDSAGNLWRAEMGNTLPGRITRMDRAGMVKVITDKNPTGGALHTPDDLVIRSDGTVYFTDPVFPHGPSTAFDLTSQLGIYRITPESDGFKVLAESTTTGPNGIELSPDEKSLYVNSYFGNTVLKFSVAANGALTKASAPLISGLSSPDSLCIDAAGNLYVGVTSGLSVYTPDGTLVTTIATTGSKAVTNCGFGGSDGKTLYISAWTTLWRVEAMPIPGLQWQKDQQIACP